MLAKLIYPIIKEYPKLNPIRYDDGENIFVKLESEKEMIHD